MKNHKRNLLLTGLLALAIAGCGGDKPDSLGEHLDEGLENVSEEIERATRDEPETPGEHLDRALENTGEALEQVGDDLEDAAEDVADDVEDATAE